MKESEKIRSQRLKQMLSGRSMGGLAQLTARDSEVSQEDEEDGVAGDTHLNTEILIE